MKNYFNAANFQVASSHSGPFWANIPQKLAQFEGSCQMAFKEWNFAIY